MASAFLIAVAIILLFIMLILIVIFIRSRRKLITTTSTLSKVPCNGPPPTPTILEVTNLQSDVLLLSWVRVSGALSYIAYLSESPNLNQIRALQSRITTTNRASFGNLALGAVYYLKVKALNSCGESPLSPEVSFNLQFVFPRRFVINNRLNPVFKLCDIHDNLYAPDDRVAAGIFCTTATSLLFYQTRDRTIRQIDRPNRCLTRVRPNTVFFNQCIENDQSQVWSYSNQTNNLCGVDSASNGRPNDCISLIPNFSPQGGLVTHGAPVNDILSDWQITPA